jgi:outer membrane protein OmpA-like peptidoglycan-associated protein
MLKSVSFAVALTLAVAGGAAAQTTPGDGASPQSSSQTPATTGTTSQATTQPQTTPSDTMSTEVQTRPATTTFMGDTGLWYVPTGEVLPRKRWSISAYRVNFDDNQGFTDVSNWPLTFGFGVGGHAEIFGSWVLVNRIDRDIRPLFVNSIPQAGGVVPQNPLARDTWSGNNLGDLWVGGKWNLMSQWQQRPAAFALRGMVKLPTGDTDSGASTGKADFEVDAIVSKEVNQRVEFSGYGGFLFRGTPDEVETTNSFKWGLGAGFPSRKALRLTAELEGEAYTNGSLQTKQPLFGTDGSFLNTGFISDVTSPVNLDLGLTWQHPHGFFAGAGWTWRLNMDTRDEFLSQYTNGAGDKMDLVVRVGYHPGVRIYVAPPPPPPPPPPPAPPAHDLTVKANCDPCTVEIGKTSTLSATATDSTGCSVTYNWTAPAGTFTNPRGQQTPWTAPNTDGPVPVTVTVTCPTDNKTATDTVNIQVVRPAVKNFVFEDVHFDFDRYSLRPEATRALDEAVRTLQENPDLRIEIEGHTCNIGTAEYNLALGERRATAVREYLTSRGINADRLRTVSYGEERPKYDNAREETRRLNRRAAMIVRITR